MRSRGIAWTLVATGTAAAIGWWVGSARTPTLDPGRIGEPVQFEEWPRLTPAEREALRRQAERLRQELAAQEAKAKAGVN